MGEPAVKTVAVKLADPDRVKLGKVTCEDDRFTPKLIPGDTPGTATLEVTFNGQDKPERVTGAVQIELVGENVKPATVSVRVQVVGNLRFPQQIFLLKTGGIYNTREIVLTSRSGDKFKVLRAEDPEGRVKLDVPKGASAEIHVVASVREDKLDEEKSVRGKILIRTSDPQNAEIAVGYTISNRDRMRNFQDKIVRQRQEQGPPKSLKPAKGARP